MPTPNRRNAFSQKVIGNRFFFVFSPKLEAPTHLELKNQRLVLDNQ